MLGTGVLRLPQRETARLKYRHAPLIGAFVMCDVTEQDNNDGKVLAYQLQKRMLSLL